MRVPKEGEAQPHTCSQSGAPVLGRGLCIPSGCENQMGCRRPRHTPQGASTDSLAQKLIRSVLRAKTAALNRTRDIQGGTKLTSFRVRAGGAEVRAALSRDKTAGSRHCSFVETPFHTACRVIDLCSPLIWLTPITPPQ